MGWGWGVGMGLSLKQSPFSAHGQPVMVGFRYSRKPGQMSGDRREACPQGTSVWCFPLSTLSAKVGNLMQRKPIYWYF